MRLLLALALLAHPVVAQPNGNNVDELAGGLRDLPRPPLSPTSPLPRDQGAADAGIPDTDSDGLDTDSDGLGLGSACSGYSGSADMYVRVCNRCMMCSCCVVIVQLCA
jgi:hypothetical protein